MRQTIPNLQTVSLALLVAILAGAGAYFGLSAYQRPPDFDTRVSNLQDRAAEIKRLSRTPASAQGYKPGALCASASDEQFTTLVGDLQSRASGLGLTVVALAVTPALPKDDRVVPVNLQVELTGPYQATTAFLGALTAQSPRVFVDRVDLVDRSSQVSLRFTGHFYCSTAT